MKNIFVGMSGGVDSSVTAMLLKNEGHNVTGVFIKTWQPDYVECTWKEDRLDAMRVCAQLDIPFVTLNLEKEYKKFVIDYFLSEYKNNRTPNPDVMCNKYIKFGAFLEYAKSCDADHIATGHYAKIEMKTKTFELFSAKDENKDQSYFLYQIKKENLSKILFPLADLEKTEIRKIAEQNNLWVADKKDSMGICMLGGDVSVKDFLIKELNPQKGNVCIYDKENKLEVIGSHEGVILYTIGERHGLDINKRQNLNKENKDQLENINENNTPYFIIEKDLENNVLIVSHNKPEQNQNKSKITLSDINFLIDLKIKENKEIFSNPVFVRSRYRGELFEVKFDIRNNTFEILENKKINTTCVSGQSLVMYDKNNRVLVGGVII